MTMFQKPLGGGFNARPADPESPKLTPEPPPAAPAAPTLHFAKDNSHMTPSGRAGASLLPSFAPLAKVLDASLQRDAARTTELYREAFITPEERLKLHRDLLAENVRDKTMSEAEAQAAWNAAHGDIDPATLLKRKS